MQRPAPHPALSGGCVTEVLGGRRGCDDDAEEALTKFTRCYVARIVCFRPSPLPLQFLTRSGKVVTHTHTQLALVNSGVAKAEDVEQELRKAEEEHRVLPEIVCAERFLKNIERNRSTFFQPPATTGTATATAAATDAGGADGEAEVVSMLEQRIRTLQREFEDETTDGWTGTTASSVSSGSDAEHDDGGGGGDAADLSLHLNPALPISTAEYEAWLRLLQALRVSRALSNTDAPRKLLLLMSSVFTSTVAIEAADALGRLYRMFSDDWFTRDLYRTLRRVTHRALALLEVGDAAGLCGSSMRKLRLKQRRKTFKARKRIWDSERKLREGLVEEYGEAVESLRCELTSAPQTASAVAHLAPAFDPEWFTTLVREHYASLEEQYARSLLEKEYAELTSQLSLITSAEAGLPQGA